MSKENKTVLVINEGGSDNFGDQIIKHSMEYLIKETGRESKFEDLTRHHYPTEHDYRAQVITKNKDIFFPLKSIVWKLLWFVKNIKRISIASLQRYDAIIVGGGQLLLPNGIFPFALLVWIKFLSLRNKNIILFSVGTQGVYSWFEKLCISSMLRKINHIYVRDKVSQNILKDQFNKESKITYDSAFILNKVYKKNEKNNSYRYLIGIVDYSVYKKYHCGDLLSEDRYYEKWLSLISDHNDLNQSALIYATPEDRAESIKFKEYIYKRLNIEVDILENNNHIFFLDNLSLGEIVVSGRMHSLIVSKALSKQFIAYPISDKVSSFLETIENKNLKKIQEKLIFDFNNLFYKI